MMDQKLAQEAHGRMVDRLYTFPAVKNEDSPYSLRKVGNKNLGMISGATDTHFIVLIKTDLAPNIVGEDAEGRAELRKEYPDDMWEFSSGSIEEVEQQFNELINRLEKE